MSDERVATIREQMTAIRGALRTDVNTIIDNARLTTDWRYYVRQYPWICTAASAALGYFVIPRSSAAPPALDPKIAETLLKNAEESAAKPAPSTLATLWKTVLLPFVVRQGLTGAISLAESAWAAKKSETNGSAEENDFARSQKPR